MNTRTALYMQELLSPAAIIMLLAGALALTIAFAPGRLQDLETMSASEPSPELLSDAEQTRMNARCDECGVVESMQRVASGECVAAGDEITVRLSDGSMRVLKDTHAAHWHPRERIIVIPGGKP